MTGAAGARTALGVACLAMAGQGAEGQIAVDTAAAELDLSGYARGIAGGSDLGYDLPGVDRRSAFTAGVVRLKWLFQSGSRVRVSVHNRVQVQASTVDSAGGTVVGFGVGSVPGASVNLRSTLLDAEHVQAWHDLDRLAVSLFLDAADVTVGRQAITWGIASIFPVADLWAQFSPFELDTEEKPGIDAVRVLAYPADGVELDAVVADRGTLRDLSAGLRATIELAGADVYVAGGKFWRQLIPLAGVAVILDTWKLRGEVAVPWDLDAGDLRPVRTTIGADRIGASWQFGVEYHRNGLGATTADGYGDRLASAELARGETYYLGRHYVGAFVARQQTDRLTVALTTLVNTADPSAAFIPALNYDAGQSARFSLGALMATGSRPAIDAAPPGLRLRSEFGTYGSSLYTTMALYF